VTSDIDRAKQAIRERVWAVLDERGAVQPPGAAGHIPSFVGAGQAAERLAEVPACRDARVVKANPDRAQLPARVLALQAGKLLYMAVPNLATLQPFYLLDPAALTTPFGQVATSQGAARLAERVSVEAMRPVDLIVCGSVAVNRQGARIGKGAGYSDIEVALLAEAGLVGEETVIATTVHDLQVIDEPLPETEHDFSVDVIATPSEVISCGRRQRPVGVYWEHLSQEKIAAIPALAVRLGKHAEPQPNAVANEADAHRDCRECQ
jgi:5-formyltetrahydrofolate cyclo-ligase